MKNKLRSLTIDSPFDEIIMPNNEEPLEDRQMIRRVVSFKHEPIKKEVIPITLLNKQTDNSQYKIQGLLKKKTIIMQINPEIEDNFIPINYIDKLNEIVSIKAKDTLGTTTKIIIIYNTF